MPLKITAFFLNATAADITVLTNSFRFSSVHAAVERTVVDRLKTSGKEALRCSEMAVGTEVKVRGGEDGKVERRGNC